MAITNSAPISIHIKPLHGFNRQQYNEDQDNASFTTEYVTQVNNILDMMAVVVTLAHLATILSVIVWDLILTWPTNSRPKLKPKLFLLHYAHMQSVKP